MEPQGYRRWPPLNISQNRYPHEVPKNPAASGESKKPTRDARHRASGSAMGMPVQFAQSPDLVSEHGTCFDVATKFVNAGLKLDDSCSVIGATSSRGAAEPL